MRYELFYGAPFVDREKEEEFLVSWLNRIPQKVLWIYGPRSSGKTTLTRYVVNKHLLGDGKRWVKYFDLREILITSYASFLDTFFVDVKSDDLEVEEKIGLNAIGVKAEALGRVKEKKENLFRVFLSKVKKMRESGKIPVFIVDEIQKLKNVYLRNSSGEKELLKEFLGLCAQMTKSEHLAHVVLLTSNSLFVEKVYGDSELEGASRFFKVDHLGREQVEEWLRREGFSEEEVELVWEYVGGRPSDLVEVLEEKKRGADLRKFLESQLTLARSRLDKVVFRLGEGKFEFLKEVAEEIVEKGFYRVKGLDEEKEFILTELTEKGILFYDPLELKVTGSSRIYEKAFELFLELERGEERSP